MMRSLPSALSSRINTGPDINMTMRTDSNLACKLLETPTDIETTVCDVREGTIVLSDAMGTGATAMQLCIGRDTVKETALDQACFNGGYVDVPCNHGPGAPGERGAYIMDVRDAQYYRDLGDARSSLEYYLRFHQVAIFFDEIDDQGGIIDENNMLFAEYYQPHLQHDYVNGNIDPNSHKCTMRRNTFFFSKRTADEVFARAPNNIQRPHAVIDYKPGYVICEIKKTNQNQHLHFYHVQVQGQAPTYLDILDIIDTALKKHHVPRVTTARQQDNMVEAVHLSESGVALTYGHMSQKNGDTAFTANIFSARTDVNGPFRAQASHDVFWIYNCEVRMFSNKTYERHKRVVLTPFLLTEISARWFRDGRGMNQLVPGPQRRLQQDCLQVDYSKTAPGTGPRKYPEFVLATRPHKMLGMDLLHLSSLRDMERVFGKVVSGGDGYASIDWVNGASTEL